MFRIKYVIVLYTIHNKHDSTTKKGLLIVGPASLTLALHKANIGSSCHVCRDIIIIVNITFYSTFQRREQCIRLFQCKKQYKYNIVNDVKYTCMSKGLRLSSTCRTSTHVRLWAHDVFKIRHTLYNMPLDLNLIETVGDILCFMF